MGVVAVNARTDGAARDSLITFVDNERVVAIDIQRRGVCAADGGAPGVIDNHVIAGNVGAGTAVGDGHITVVVDAGVIAVNDGAGGACAADVRGTGIFNRGVVAVDDDGGAAAAHGNVTGEIGGGAVAGNQRAGGVVHRGVARNGVGGAVTGDNHAGGAVGHTGVPGERVDGSIAGNNHAGAILAADIHAAIGVMRLVIAADNRGVIVGNNQIATAVVLPVETVFLGAFNHGGIGVGHVPAGDVQRFAVCGGELPLVVLF